MIESVIQTSLKEKSNFKTIIPTEEKEFYPLSTAQKRLYILQFQTGNKSDYTSTYKIPLNSRIDAEKVVFFEGIFKSLIERHESLRTSFQIIKSDIVQNIHKNVNFSIERHEITSKRSFEHIAAHFFKPFDPEQAPLFRACLVSGDIESSFLLFHIHHMIADEISMKILKDEFTALVSNEILPVLNLQYKDYSEWQNSDEFVDQFKSPDNYWVNEFSDEIPAIHLPFDFPFPPRKSITGNTITAEIDGIYSEPLLKLSREKSVDLCITTLALTGILLSKISSAENIIVGTPVSGRFHPELHNMIGNFVNTLPLRLLPSPEKSLEAYLGEVNYRTQLAFENQVYPFEVLLNKPQFQRHQAQHPLFDILFDYHWPEPESTGFSQRGSLNESTLSPHHLSSYPYDLTFHFTETPDRLILSINFCAELFKPKTIERFIEYFKNIVSMVSLHPGTKLSEINIISNEEKKKIVSLFNHRENECPELSLIQTIHHAFEQQVLKTPDRTALIDTTSADSDNPISHILHLTYMELNLRSNCIARELHSKGVERGSIIGLMLERSAEMITGILGILKAGCAYLPIDPTYPKDRIDYMLKDSGAKIIIDAEAKHLQTNDFTNASPLRGTLSDLAYIIYTSGSTGKPKGVLIEHASVINLIESRKERFGITPEERILQFSSFSFDASVEQIFLALLSGAALVLINKNTLLDRTAFDKIIMDQSVTHLNTVPLFLKNIETIPRGYHLKRIVVGGDECPIDVIRKWAEHSIDVFNAYGPTETTITALDFHVNIKNINELSSQTTVPIGKPIKNTIVFLLDKLMHVVPIGVAGELHIGGAGLSRGYLNRPELTAEKFVLDSLRGQQVSGALFEGDNCFAPGPRKNFSLNKNFLLEKDNEAESFGPTFFKRLAAGGILYKTGDLARWLPDGNIEFLGRIDDQVKIRGFRIELTEIEARIKTHENVEDVIVIARKDASAESFLCAYIVPKSFDTPLERRELNRFLSASLPYYMIPSHAVNIDRFPLTPSGKIDKKSLPEPEIGEISETDEFCAPQNFIEKELTEIWADLLNVSPSVISIDSNFFDIGGQSIKATSLALRIHKQFNTKIPLTLIFNQPTIRQMADYIKNSSVESFSAIEKAEKKEYYDLSSAQKRLFIMHQLEPEDTTYNMFSMFPIDPVTSVENLKEIFKEIVNRHESFRTSFILINGEPVQRIHHSEDLNPDIEIFSIANENLENSQAISDLSNRFIRPFDLSRPPLIRVGLITSENTFNILMIDTHHIVSDGVSTEILAREFISLRNNATLSPLRLQYTDFSEWQKKSIESGEIKEQEVYWLNRFNKKIPTISMPTDFPRKPVSNTNGHFLKLTLQRHLTESLKKIIQETQTTFFMLLLAVESILISKYTQQEDIIIGTGTTGRTHADLENIIGMFINMLPLWNRVNKTVPFDEFLQSVKSVVLEAYENQDYQYETLVEKLGIERIPGRNPIFDFTLTFDKREETTENTQDSPALNEITSGQTTAKFDLLIRAAQQGNDLSLSFEYQSALFKETTIREFITHFIEIIEQITSNVKIRLEDIKISHRLLAAKSDLLEEEDDSFGF